MKWDLLLEWMTHLGTGHWGAFREAVEQLSDGDGTDADQAVRTMRIVLSDLGHADFFVRGSRQWQVLRPAILGFQGGSKYQLSGGRTRRLLETLTTRSGEVGVGVEATILHDGLSSIQLIGASEAMCRLANSLGLDCFSNAGARIAAGCKALRHTLDQAPTAAEPINWSVESWSFEGLAWIAERIPETARRYTNRYGARRYMVPVGRSRLKELGPREVVHAAALLRGGTIVRYHENEQQLVVPRRAPLPAEYARAASLSSGTLSIPREGDMVFEGVAPEVAEIVLAKLGQRYVIAGAPR